MSLAIDEGAKTGFWESRTGWTRLKAALLLEPLPGGARWAAAFGSMLLFTFAIQVLTGVLLTMSYAPSVSTAWESVKFIQDGLPLGRFVRSVHHWGSSAMVVLLLAHLLQVFIWGAYKRPRELTWMVGVLLLFLVLGLAFTGYLLPWDERAYWATKVGLGILSTVPVVGDSLRTLLQGGSDLGNLTLTRFFCLHGFILPGLIILLVVVHLYLFRLHSVTPGWWKSPDRLARESEPFWPGQAWKDGVCALVLILALGVWCYYTPAPLAEHADPSKPYEARPEWYFMFLFQLLRYFQGRYEIVGTFVLPSVLFLVIFFWPLLDRSPHRNPRRRPVAMSLLALGTAGLLGMTAFAVITDVRMKEPETARTTLAAPPGPLQKLDVAAIFGTECASCHGQDGSGNQLRAAMPTIPDFSGRAWQAIQTDSAISIRIQEGKPPFMPAFRDKLNDAQVEALVQYIRQFAASPDAKTK